MKFSARSALLQSFKTEVQVMQEYVRVDKTALAEISSVISFNGPGTTGSVVVSGSEVSSKTPAIRFCPMTGRPIRMKRLPWLERCAIR